MKIKKDMWWWKEVCETIGGYMGLHFIIVAMASGAAFIAADIGDVRIIENNRIITVLFISIIAGLPLAFCFIGDYIQGLKSAQKNRLIYHYTSEEVAYEQIEPLIEGAIKSLINKNNKKED